MWQSHIRIKLTRVSKKRERYLVELGICANALMTCCKLQSQLIFFDQWLA